MQTIENKALNRIYGHGRGWSFSKIDFSDFGPPNTIDQTLSRLQKSGTIRRISRGIYDYPIYSKLLKKVLSPDIHQVAQAFARKFNWTIQVSGNTALNILGLSTQVPTQYLYHSNGKSKTYEVSGIKLTFKKTRLKEIGFKSIDSELIVEAIKALGQQAISQEYRQKIADCFTLDKQVKILKDTRYTTSWVYEEIKQIFSMPRQ